MASWLKQGHCAAISGGASGIGYAAAQHFLTLGMNVAIADIDAESLATAVETLATGASGEVFGQPCDVSDYAQVEQWHDRVLETFGAPVCLMNNAGTALQSGTPWEHLQPFTDTMNINFMGIVHGCQAFMPAMLEAEQPGAVINTGSKQGLTNPPGNCAYNASKAAVRAYTESIAHALRQLNNCQLSAHLLVPGFTYTGLISRFVKEKPPAAWNSKQVVEFMLSSLQQGDFYIVCPDNDVTRAMDEKRIQWNTDDLIQNRPALSRWHPEYQQAFETFMTTD